MKEYIYIAISDKGKKVEGIIDAINIEEAKSKLRSRGLRIINIEEKKVKNPLKKKNKKKLGLDLVSHFCRQFAIIINSGIGSIVGLEILIKRSDNDVLGNEIKRLLESIKKGATISNAMLEKESKFPKLLGTMIAIGEETGRLEEVLKNMAVFYEREYRMNKKIKNAMTYPIIVFILSIVMLIILTAFIIPQLMNTILELDGEIPLITTIVMAIANFMQKYWWIIAVILMVGTYIIKMYMKVEKGRRIKDKIVDKIPLVKDVVRSIVTMRFTRSLNLFISTGYPILQGLDFIKVNLENILAEEAIGEAKDGLIRGQGLADNLGNNGYFDQILIQMIEVGDQTGQLDTITDEMARFYEHESEIQLEKIISMIEPVMIVIVGVVVGILVLAVFIPMIKMYEFI